MVRSRETPKGFGLFYRGNPILSFNSLLGKAMELSIPKRKCNKMILPKNRKSSNKSVSFSVIYVHFLFFVFRNELNYSWRHQTDSK